jgi:hypothetical protein
VNEIDNGSKNIWISVWLHAVSEIKDMAGMTSILFQHIGCASKSNIGAGKN